MKSIGIIPARFASTRFPGKPLIDLGGKTMIQRVYEQALKADLDKVIIATDNLEIAEHAKSIGANYCLTREDHQSGTDRCAEVSALYPEYDLVINIQGDEPFIDPTQINLVKEALNKPEAQISTLIKEVANETELFNENSPKVVINENSEALYFSRQTIPFLRNIDKSEWLNNHTYYKHIGIYGFKRDVLLALTKLKPHALEQAESLEQLRWLANGYRISTHKTTIETMAIDSPEDVVKINKAYNLTKLICFALIGLFSFSACSNADSSDSKKTEKLEIPNQVNNAPAKDLALQDSPSTTPSVGAEAEAVDAAALFSNTHQTVFSKLGENDNFKISLIGSKASETKLVFEIFNSAGSKIYQAEIKGREILKSNPNLRTESEKIKYLKTEAEFFFDEEHFMDPAVMPDENADENVPDKAFHQELKNTKLPGFYFRDGEESTVYIAWSNTAKQVKIYYKCCKK